MSANKRSIGAKEGVCPRIAGAPAFAVTASRRQAAPEAGGQGEPSPTKMVKSVFSIRDFNRAT